MPDDMHRGAGPERRTRRRFLHALGLGALAAPALAPFASAQPDGPATTPAPRLPLIKPPRLRRGDTIGLICPASALEGPRLLNEARDDLERIGFQTRPGRHCLARHGYLAGTDEQRARDVMDMFEDDSIDGIIAIRGGWGAPRILPLLDYDSIRANAKPLIGYSDITALLLAVYARSGIVTFHGPVGRSTWSAGTTRAFLDVLMRGERLELDPIAMMGPDGERPSRARMAPRLIVDGRAEGPLAGGNLSVLAAMVGTPYLPDFRDHVVFFEDVNEPLYRVDRLITQLKQAGTLHGTAGLVFGQCSSCASDSGIDVQQLLTEHLRPLRRPAWSGAPIGHVSPVYTLPIGIRAATDSALGTLAMMEAAVA